MDDLTELVGEAKDVEIEGGTTVEIEVIQIIGQLERKNCDAASASQLDRALEAAGPRASVTTDA